MAILNLAFYRFVPLADPGAAAAGLKAGMEHLAVKGTLILAEEGLNAFLAGPEAEVREAFAWVERQEPFRGITAKESYSDSTPFEKLCFKVKPEIVTFRRPVAIDDAPRIQPQTLKDWYDRGEDFLVLDTRNAFEVRAGSFAGAKSLGLKRFVELADTPLPEDWRGRRIVTYCTGGIRCEKAAPFLRSQGFDAYQLEGGILNYFETVGGAHWQGECFVFDQRVAVDPGLKPTGSYLCANCQGPVPAGASACPHCGA